MDLEEVEGRGIWKKNIQTAGKKEKRRGAYFLSKDTKSYYGNKGQWGTTKFVIGLKQTKGARRRKSAK